jgi:hypothetical protein
MIRRPFVVLVAALALSCAVVAGTKAPLPRKAKPPAETAATTVVPAQETAQPSASGVVTSASSETPSVTIPLAPPAAQPLTPVQPVAVAAPPATAEPPKVEPVKTEPPKTETALAPPEPAKGEPAKADAPKTETALAPPPPREPIVKTVVPQPLAKPKLEKPKAKPKLTPAKTAKPEAVAAIEPASSKPPAFRCFVRDVMAFYDRTHVRCYNKARGQIAFFAVDTAQPISATVLSKALNGMQMGKPVTIVFAPGADLNPSNCDVKNCRRLLDIN